MSDSELSTRQLGVFGAVYVGLTVGAVWVTISQTDELLLAGVYGLFAGTVALAFIAAAYFLIMFSNLFGGS